MALMGFPALFGSHRLDSCVSGVTILGRSTRQQARLMKAISAGTTRKTYIARVLTPLEGPLICTTPLVTLHGKAVASSGGKAAETRIVPLGPPLLDGTQLVECTPLQGRKHQIRAHLSILGSPIANDRKYGGSLFSVATNE